MPGPARAGSLVYAKDIEQLAVFYARLLGMLKVHASTDHVVLASPDFQLIIHAMPPEIAKTVVVTSPPERREQTPIKLFFTVPSISVARACAASLGGEVFCSSGRAPVFRCVMPVILRAIFFRCGKPRVKRRPR